MNASSSQFSVFGRATIIAAAVLALAACSNLDDTQQKVLSGGAVGAGVGTIGTLITGGCVPCGTVVGAAVGAGTGYALDYLDKNTKSDSGSGSSGSYHSSSNNGNYTGVTSYNNAPPATAAPSGPNSY
jgi:hypothetical protein